MRRPKTWVKYGNIPLEYVLKHRNEIENSCDSETSLFCYCGRLATGFHTSSCIKYRAKFQTKMEELYNKEEHNG